MTDKCMFYPTDKELNESGPFCGQSSDVSGEICTKEDEGKCQWALEGIENAKIKDNN